MFRKILLSTLAALGLIAGTVAPIEAHPVYVHRPIHRQVYRPWTHRVFYSSVTANAWMASQRQLGFDCYSVWQGPQCFIYYR